MTDITHITTLMKTGLQACIAAHGGSTPGGWEASAPLGIPSDSPLTVFQIWTKKANPQDPSWCIARNLKKPDAHAIATYHNAASTYEAWINEIEWHLEQIASAKAMMNSGVSRANAIIRKHEQRILTIARTLATGPEFADLRKALEVWDG